MDNLINNIERFPQGHPIRVYIEEKNLDNILNDLIVVFNSLSQLMLAEGKRYMRVIVKLLGCSAQYPPKVQEGYVHPSLDTKKRKLSFSLEDRTHFDEAYLTMEQVNFIFKFLPVDITYVDENDKVVFYNRGDDRVFPRSAGIIGREVKFCHPPKSVDQVLKILEEFKGKFIHIRYFAIRDDERNYKGVIELSQDVTEIKALEGQKRLLDWN